MPKIDVDYRPYPFQEEVHKSRARFRILVAGRRSGKTYLAIAECLMRALKRPNRRIGWFAPTFAITGVAEDTLFKMVSADPGTMEFKKSLREFDFANGSKLRLFSTDSLVGALGRSFDFVVLDEAAEISDEAWERVIRPTLADTQGRGLFCSTPLYKSGFFHQSYLRGLDPDEPDYESFHLPSAGNPYIPPSEIRAARRDMPSVLYNQQFGAQFQAAGGSVFRDLGHLFSDDDLPLEPEPGVQYCGGLDLAKSEDYSVLLVADAVNRRVVAGYRWHGEPWPVQIDRIGQICRHWKLEAVYADATGLGGPVTDAMKFSEDLPVKPITFTQAEKARLINQTVLAVEQQAITVPAPGKGEIWKTLKHEMEAFQSTLLPGGTIRYSHPDGGHDDVVISLCLALDASIRGTATLALEV